MLTAFDQENTPVTFSLFLLQFCRIYSTLFTDAVLHYRNKKGCICVYCPNCGQENNNADRFCASCGTPLAPCPSPVGQKILSAVKDPLFLVLCILYSVYTVMQMFSPEFSGIPVISTLLTIFLWLAYAQGRKGIVPGKYVRCLSGTVFADYVLGWILFGIIALCGLLMLTFASAVDVAAFVEEVLPEIEDRIGQSLPAGIDLFYSIFSFGFAFIGIVLLFVAACGIVLNLVGLRPIHRFLQSSYKAADGYGTVCKVNAAKSWLIVFAVFAGLSALSGILNPSTLLCKGSECAALIIASVLISRHFGE